MRWEKRLYPAGTAGNAGTAGEPGYRLRLSIPAGDSCAPGGLWEDFINVIEVFEERDRRQGTASALVQAVLTAAREKGSIQVRAYCDIRNEASHRLWLKNGFCISPAVQSDGSIPGSFVSIRL